MNCCSTENTRLRRVEDLTSGKRKGYPAQFDYVERKSVREFVCLAAYPRASKVLISAKYLVLHVRSGCRDQGTTLFEVSEPRFWNSGKSGLAALR
jgi:hypothetical protein